MPLFTKSNFSLWINCILAQHFFDPYQLVVFCDAIRTTCRTGFYLSAVQRYGKIRDGCIFCFPAAVTHNRIVTIMLGKRYSIDGFREGSDLIHFHEQRVCRMGINPFLQPLHIGYK